jgi:adenylate cyclase
MTCPRCHIEPPSDAEFCPECGVKISVECWNCRTANRLTDHFCKHCGHGLTSRLADLTVTRTHDGAPRHKSGAILRSRVSMEGERKVVTVLFADIKGSTELLASLDPEEARKVLDPILARMIESVQRHEGTVNQVLGDGIMALFGAPLAHEDHAIRACHAALAMRDAVQSFARETTDTPDGLLNIRVGLNSGEVVVRAIDSDLQMDYSAVGLTTHLAARMEQIAEPDAIYMTEMTWRLAMRSVEATALGPRSVRGLVEPIQVWELMSAKSADRETLVMELGSVFVGRSLEMSLLDQAREASGRGDVRVIGISGHPGVGKTRLSLEFVEHCRQGGARAMVLRAVPHGRARPFALVLDFLRQYFDLDPSSDTAAYRRAIEHQMASRGASIDITPVVELLEEVDTVKLAAAGSEFRRDVLFETIAKIIRLESTYNFVVLLLEDLHWLGGIDEMFVESLVDALPGGAAMLVTNFRPPYVSGWMQRSYYQQIPLSPLQEPDAAALIDALMGTDPSLEGIRGRILERGQGNPFFLEELVHALAGSGRLLGAPGAYHLRDSDLAIELPLTVNAVLSSRIDRLPPTAREVLQTAAVIGKDFAHDVLEQVVEIAATELSAALRTLLQGEFILRSGSAGGQQFSFRHPLIQEVSYQSQVADRRIRLHRKIAAVLTTLYPDRLSELSGLIAFHREAAGDIHEAAEYTVRAAMWVGLRDPRQAAAHWVQARELLDRLPSDDRVLDLKRLVSGQLLNLAWRVGMPLSQATEHYQTAVALATRVGDFRAHALALASYGRVLACLGSADGYVTHAKQALAMARERGDRGLIPLLLTMVGQALRLAGFLAPALETTDEALRKAPHSGDLGFNVPLWMIGVRAQCLAWLGRFDDARKTLAEMVDLVQAEPDLSLRMMPRVTYAEIASLTNDAALASEQRSAAEQLLGEGKSAYLRVHTLAITGIAEILGGSAERAIGALEEALEVARTNGAALDFEARILSDLSDAQLRAGRPTDALTTARLAAELAHVRTNRIALCLATLRTASALGADPSPDRRSMGEALQRAEGLIQETGAAALRPLLESCQQRCG